jgi:aminopeptidase N
LAKVSVKQVQKLSSEVLLFNFPLTIRFKGKSGAVDRHVQIKQREEDFYFPLESAPEIVRLDPEYTLLAKVTFRLPNAMLHAQLADASDVIGRLAAVEQMGEKKDKATVAKLKEALNNDAFYGVRVEASRALRSIYTDDALEALLASTKQSDARVRRQVISDIGDFYRDTAYESARKSLESEKNPVIVAEALASLGGYAKPEVRELLLKFLASTSYRNELANAAVGAMRSQDDSAYVTPMREALSRRESEFTTGGFSQGLNALAYLARNEENKNEVREFLVLHLENKKRNVQRTAINALRTLGDPKAIGVLEKLATASKDSPERTAAERALSDLRAGRKPVDDFKNLRQEVLDLQKANRDLRKELDDLKKKVEAQATGTQPPARKPAPVTARSPKGR